MKFVLILLAEVHIDCPYSAVQINQENKDLDLTYKPLEPGDLPLPQDGKVDKNDFDYLWKNRGKSDENILKIGDLNLDGIINMGDINLLLQTLETRYDEVGW